jgi:hypothetical protein
MIDEPLNFGSSFRRRTPFLPVPLPAASSSSLLTRATTIEEEPGELAHEPA